MSSPVSSLSFIPQIWPQVWLLISILPGFKLNINGNIIYYSCFWIFSPNILFVRFVYGIGGKKSSSQSAYILSGLQLKRVRQISTYPRALAARTSVPVPGSQEYHEINNSSADIRDVRICMYMFQPSLLVGWLLVAYFMLIPRNSQWT